MLNLYDRASACVCVGGQLQKWNTPLNGSVKAELKCCQSLSKFPKALKAASGSLECAARWVFTLMFAACHAWVAFSGEQQEGSVSVIYSS